MGLLFADSLSRMFYSTVCRELNPGQTKALRDQYLKKAVRMVEQGQHNQLPELAKEAVKSFNAIPVDHKPVQAVGIVGEIYIKYNAFGQFNVVDWLIENRVEVVLPPLFEFFTQSFVNSKVNQREYLEHSAPFSFIGSLIGWRANYLINKFEKIISQYNYYRPVHSIEHEPKKLKRY
jgi:predicted nucleotide-binding protein (sugar kinase/HSP70/actin superfamily)